MLQMQILFLGDQLRFIFQSLCVATALDFILHACYDSYSVNRRSAIGMSKYFKQQASHDAEGVYERAASSYFLYSYVFTASRMNIHRGYERYTRILNSVTK